MVRRAGFAVVRRAGGALVPAGVAVVEVNLKQMAKQLGCSLPTMSALVDRWPGFPVIERGDLGKQWRFDAEAVVAFLQEKRADESRLKAARDEQLAQLTLPIIRTDDAGRTISLDDQLKAVKLRALQREEAKEKGFLVPTLEVREALERALRRYGDVEASAIERVVRNHNLPDAVKRALEREFQEARVMFVREAGKFIADTAKDDGLALFG